MKANSKIAIALVAGVTIGGAIIQGLHAQAKPPTLVVVDISQVTDAEAFKAIGQRTDAAAEAVFKNLGGRYLARTSKITALDGAAPQRFVIIAFDSPEKVQAWKNSPGQKEVDAIRVKSTKSRSFTVEGM